MIEATCAACGTLNRIAETDVPAGTKFVTCSSCKSRVALQAKPGAKPPASPPGPAPKMPPPVPSASPAGMANDVIDLSDLPTPKRPKPPGATPPPRPGSVGLDAELPAPKQAARPPAAATLDLDDLMPADLPAPKARAATPPPRPPSIADLPAPKGKAPSIADLPAPKAKGGPPAPPKPTAGIDLADLPAPKGGITDLPAPKDGITDLPMPKATSIADLPAPKARTSALADLPAPKGKPTPSPLADLPKGGAPDIVDLPTPKGGITDLPAPKAGVADLPAPVGFFDDLPQPAKASRQNIDLPAPKGFFDDLPRPAASSAAGSTDLPAPKGFFDDLPKPAAPKAEAKGQSGGFFDDLPEPAPAAKPAARGMFDDLPEPTASSRNEASAPDLFSQPGGLELDLSPPGTSSGSSGGRASMPNTLSLEGDSSGPELDLALAGDPVPAASAPKFQDLDLKDPADKGAIRFAKPSADKPKTEVKRTPTPMAPGGQGKNAELKLELAEDIGRGPAAEAKIATKKKVVAATEVNAEAKAKKQKRTKLVLGGVIGLALVGSGGFYMYQRHVAAKARADQIAEQITTARSALKAEDAKHWLRASNAASAVLELDDHNAAALGIGAEALLAGALDTGEGGATRIARGRKMVQDALGAGVTGPEIERAQALAAIAANQADRAVQKLEGMVAKSPNDPFLQLYLGWAYVAKGDAAAAVKPFDAAAANPAVKVAALYSRGRAKLALADLPGATDDFSAVLKVAKEHIPAMIGLAAALPPSQSSQREADLLGILARKDIATADPRSVTLAWTLAADAARSTGRLDVARERYRKALALIATDTGALTGLATVELGDKKIDLAADLIQKALSTAADNIDAQLLAAEILIRQGKLPDATALSTKLAGRVPPLTPLPHARLLIVQAKLLEAQGKDDDAADTLVEASKLAGDLDLAPTMIAVGKLSDLAKKADEKSDPKAADYRARAEQLLSSLAERAQEDGALAMTLGIAYLQAGDAAKAETLLRRAVNMRGTDIEAKLALSKALAKLGRTDDALEQLRAASAQDAARIDIALELALTLENAGRDADAAKAYNKMLENKDLPVVARVRAGRFFAHTGDLARAAEQIEPILSAEPDNAAGHYLKGEKQLAANKLDEARKELALAVDADAEAQYLDAQGRAAELSADADTKFEELALHAYTRASEVDPKMFNPWAGQGRIYVKRKEVAKAATALNNAIKIKPDDAGVMHDLGISARDLGQKPVAIQWLEKSTRIRPDADASWELGMLYSDVNRAGDDHRMAEALTKATQLGSAKEKQTGKVIDWLSDAYYYLGQIEGTIGNAPAQKRAWEIWIDRPHRANDDAKLNEVKYALGTRLKNVAP